MTYSIWTEVRPIPKPSEKENLTDKEKRDIKRQLFRRAKGRCEGCGRIIPLTVSDINGKQVFDKFRCGHFSHNKSKGSGGRYTLKNGKYLCFTCHGEWEDRTGKFKDRGKV